MKAVFSVDVEPDLHTNNFEGITKGIPKLLFLLDRYKVKATFFVTGKILEKYPSVIKSLKSKGHEIAIHSYSHKRYDILTFQEKKQDLEKCIKIYKKMFNSYPKGFRAPQHSIDQITLELLERNNFKYDSSKTPANLMLFRHLFKKGKKKNIILNFFSEFKHYKIQDNLVEIPRTALLFSVGGFELKLYPKISYKTLISLFKLLNIDFIFVMHSWDMIYIPNSKTSRLCSSEKFEKNLNTFLKYSTKKLKYVKMEQLI